LCVGDVAHGDQILSRAKVIQKKTGRPVCFELTPETRSALQGWIVEAGLSAGDFLFFSRIDRNRHLTTRQYARIVHGWVAMIGADPSEYGTHSLRRSKATLIYRQTKNLRAVQLLLGHTKLESTLRYLGVEVDDALEIAEHTEI
jgi:integrase